MKERGLQLLLIASLLLNVFIVGALIGAAVVWQREARPPTVALAAQPTRLRLAAMSLSPPYRRQLRQHLAQTARALRPQVDEARAARLDAQRLLSAPTLDAAALRAALERARSADEAIRSRIEASLVDFAATLPQAERSALAQALQRPARRPGAPDEAGR